MKDFPTPFTADHQGFYHYGEPFFPLIQERCFPAMEWSNTAVIRLPAQLKDDLDWSEQIKQAQGCLSSGKFILWELDLGLDHYSFDPDDTATFFSFSVALDEFSSTIWSQFYAHTFGIILYRGDFHLSTHFPLSQWEHTFQEWAQEMKSDYSVYCFQNLADYLHRLVSFLPEAILVFAWIDVSFMASVAKMAQLVSKERFEHIHLILKGAHCPFSGITYEDGIIAQGWIGNVPLTNIEKRSISSLGILLPKDPFIDETTLAQLDQVIQVLNRANTPFRFIPEEKLTEQWDGLDKLIIPAQTISPQGRRKLLGFIAAGGTIATMNGTWDLPEEDLFFEEK